MTVGIRSAFVLALVLAVSAVHAQRASRPEPRWIQVEGSVVTAGRGESIRGAMITVVAKEPAHVSDPTFADARGDFVVRVPDVRGITVRVSKPGFVAESVPVDLGQGAAPLVVPLSPAGAIAGQVLEGAGLPLSNFRITVRRQDDRRRQATSESISAATDDLGEFRVGGLAPGRYVVSIPNNEIVVRRLTTFTPLKPGSTPSIVPEYAVEVEAGRVTHLTHQVPMRDTSLGDRAMRELVTTPVLIATNGNPRAAVISGRVIDGYGDPLDGINVFAIRLAHTASGSMQLELGPPRMTDDRGIFRLYSLRDGAHLIFTSLKNSDPLSANVYGGTGLDQALPVQARAGYEAAGLEVPFAMPRLSHITGSVANASGRTGLVGMITLAARTPFGTIALPTSMEVATDGTFEIPRLPPGSYAVIATGKGAGEIREFGVAEVAIDAGVPGTVAVTTSPGTIVAGRVRFDDETVKTSEQVGLALAPQDPIFSGVPYTGGFIRDRAFRIEGAAGSARLVLEGAPPGWWIEGVMVDGRDVTDVPFPFGERNTDKVEVRIATRSGVIAGTVQGPPTANQSVVAYSVDRERWYPQSRFLRMAKATGTFGITGLPPGEYYVATVNTPISARAHGEWQNAEFLEALTPTAQRVTVGTTTRTTLQFSVPGSTCDVRFAVRC